jgi:DNA-binding NarL/FixJ family response regulator
MERSSSPRGERDAFPERPRRILIVDDDRVVCSFARKILEHEGHTVSVADSVGTARSALHHEVDVAVIDVDLPDGEGFELVELLRQRFARPIPVVLITGSPTDDYLRKSVSQGIIEFLFKPFHAKDLRAAVERGLVARARWETRVDALSGGNLERRSGTHLAPKPIPIPPSEVEDLCRVLSDRHGLTERERETLGHILAGLQNADIATALQISANTVKYHVRNVLTKLGMESRTELFRSLLNQSE